MKAVVQRVSRAVCRIDGEVAGEVGRGFLVLLGVWAGDTDEDCRWVADKVAGLRVFEDEAGKLNLALSDVGGGVLVVPNFTIAGNCTKGMRPSFIAAERPERAIPLFELFKETLRAHGLPVASGVFGADMKVELVNDGPVTLIVERGENKF
ncbi:MAG TPA: D-aminoacyl-tRNA deacylase [Terriglobales bacterium]|nr:D-aminoacyl-tRNA deacylase [Terriglobales bacterium]